jgi:NAD(P)H-dependent FMN reductase
MNVIVFSGSARPQRQSHQVAEVVKERLEKSGHAVTMLDVRELNFPLLQDTFDKLTDAPEKMKAASRAISASDGLVVVSPEHNGSFSGALKNTMDYFFKEYKGKPFGVVGVSSGMLGGVKATRNL